MASLLRLIVSIVLIVLKLCIQYIITHCIVLFVLWIQYPVRMCPLLADHLGAEAVYGCPLCILYIVCNTYYTLLGNDSVVVYAKTYYFIIVMIH